MKEYWIVLGPERRVEVYRNPQDGHYLVMRVFGPADEIECVGVPGVRSRVSDLFA